MTGDVQTTVHPQAPFHSSTLEAFQNSLADPAQTANLVGFGMEGVIFTGAGSDRTMDESKYISVVSLEHVESWFRAQQPMSATKVVFCSCDTGAGNRGQEFLSAAADSLGVEVSAPSGLVYVDYACRQLYLESGATWVSATPSLKPQAVNPPNPQPDNPPPTSIILFTPNTIEQPLPVDHKIPAKSVQRVRFFGGPTRFYSPWVGGKAVDALPFLHLDAPFFASPVTLAVITGRLAVTTAELGTRSFRVLNNRIIQDELVPSVYYYVNLGPLFTAML